MPIVETYEAVLGAKRMEEVKELAFRDHVN